MALPFSSSMPVHAHADACAANLVFCAGMPASHTHRQAAKVHARQDMAELRRHISMQAWQRRRAQSLAGQEAAHPQEDSQDQGWRGGLVPHEGQGAQAAAPSRAPRKLGRGRRSR